jgi:LPXTG-site transpeptidase (sortase) family protein
VKYPFTADPGQKGNTLIFGHSSVDFRETKNNPYGFIFSHLNELQVGDTIEIVRNGQQHMYRVEETVIKNPTEVNEVISEFTNDKFLTLMACYPRFSTAQRILVVAKAIDKSDIEAGRLAMHDTPVHIN